MTSGLWPTPSRHKAKNSTGGILALAPSLLVPPLPAAPQQQELDRATVGDSATGTLLGSCRQWWCQALTLGKQRSRLPLLPHRQAHTVLAVRGGCFGAIITPALREAPFSSFLPTCRCMYRPKHQQCGCALGRHFIFLSSPQPQTACPLGYTTSVPSATCPPSARSVSMQYSTSSVGHAQLALELGIVFFVINVLEGFPSPPPPLPPVELYCCCTVS